MTTGTTVFRRYALIRVTAGDWLLPSNDLELLWRLQRHPDGAHYGLEVDYEERWFWMASWVPMPDESAIMCLDVDTLDWQCWAHMLGSRREAITAALTARPR